MLKKMIPQSALSLSNFGSRTLDRELVYEDWKKSVQAGMIQKIFFILTALGLASFFLDYIVLGEHYWKFLPFRFFQFFSFAVLATLVRLTNRALKSNFNGIIRSPELLILAGTLSIVFADIFFYQDQLKKSDPLMLVILYFNVYIAYALSYLFPLAHWITAIVFTVASKWFAEDWLGTSAWGEMIWLWNFAAFSFTFFNRELYFSKTLEQYKGLLLHHSPEVARQLLLAANMKESLENLRPEYKHCVCICIDWRSFQKMTAQTSVGHLAFMIEKSHEVILEILRAKSSNVTFHADWSADEIFVTIYSPNNNTRELKDQSCAIIKEIQLHYRSILEPYLGSWTPTIDLGAAYGRSIIGLLGPQNIKKMTALGQVGGRAKRLETEAKTVRKDFEIINTNCIVAIDSFLYKHFQDLDREWSETFKGRKPVTKDISKESVFVSLGSVG